MIGPVDRCRDLRATMPLVAAGIADGRDVLRLSDHLADGCASCASELERLQQRFFDHPAGEPGATLPSDLIPRIVDRARAQPQDAPEDVLPWPRERELPFLRGLLVLAGITVAAVGLWGWQIRAARDAAQAQIAHVAGRLQLAEGAVDDARSKQQEATERANLALSAETLVFDLIGPDVRARVVAPSAASPGVFAATRWPPRGTDGQIILWMRRGGDHLPLTRMPFAGSDGAVPPISLPIGVPLQEDAHLILTLEAGDLVPQAPGERILAEAWPLRGSAVAPTP